MPWCDAWYILRLRRQMDGEGVLDYEYTICQMDEEADYDVQPQGDGFEGESELPVVDAEHEPAEGLPDIQGEAREDADRGGAPSRCSGG